MLDVHQASSVCIKKLLTELQIHIQEL